MSDVLALASGWTLAGIFLLAAAHKVRNYLAFRGVLGQYRLLPEALVGIAAPAIVVAEIAAALALLTPAHLVPGIPTASLAALLLCVYTGAIAVNLIRGRTAIDCGCGGEPTPLSGWLLARNGLLLGLAFTAGTGAAPDRAPGLLLLAAAPTAFLWSAYAIGNQLLANRHRAWPDLPGWQDG